MATHTLMHLNQPVSQPISFSPVQTTIAHTQEAISDIPQDQNLLSIRSRLPKMPSLGAKIIPLSSLDSRPFVQTTSICHMLVFGTVLDPEKLQSSLNMLVEKEGWRKIGARLKRRWNGQLEYHIPNDFTALRPAIRFSRKDYGLNMKDHPIASHIPGAVPSKFPFVVPHSEEFGPLAYDQMTPKTTWGYVGVDIPQLALHIGVFNDATIVSISGPHTFCDGVGMKALLESWVLLLKNPEAEVPRPYEVESNPPASLGKNPTETYKMMNQRASMWQHLAHVVRKLPESLLCSRINRVVCVPSSLVVSLREAALKDIAMIPDASASFVTDNDILFAWWARTVISCAPRSQNHKVNLVTTTSLSVPLSRDLLPSDCLYLSNAIGFLQTLTTRKELLGEPLGYTAYRIRQTIQEQNMREQIEAQEALTEESFLKLPVVLRDWSTEALLSSSHGKINLYDLDFSSARRDWLSAPSSPVKPFYHQIFLPGELSHLITPSSIFLGKDAVGNYWISTTLRKPVWDGIEAAPPRLPG